MEIKDFLEKRNAAFHDLQNSQNQLNQYRATLKQQEQELFHAKRRGEETEHIIEQQEKTRAAINQLVRDTDISWEESQGVFEENSAEKLLELFALKANVPFLLFPVRLETRFGYAEGRLSSLKVRIYPDDIAIDSFEEGLTVEEIEFAIDFWESYTTEGPNQDTTNLEAWIELVQAVGPERAAYIFHQGETWLTSKDYNIRPESWSQPHYSYVMPDFFEVSLQIPEEKNGQISYRSITSKRGGFIPPMLPYSPDPQRNDGDDEVFFDKGSLWIADFEEAIKVGMAVEFTFDAGSEILNYLANDENAGIRVLALGIREPKGKNTDKEALGQLFKNHYYSNGFSLLSNGTPTNNVSGKDSAWNSSEENYEDTYKLVVKGLDPSEKSDGKRFVDFLRINSDDDKDDFFTFKHVKNADLTQDEDAKIMMQALWPVSWGYFLERLLFDVKASSSSIQTIKEIQNHYNNYVRAGGHISAFRIDDIPYTVLPVSDFFNWKPSWDISPLNWEKFKAFLEKVSEVWLAIADNREWIPRIRPSGDPNKELMAVLGMEAYNKNINIRSLVHKSYLETISGYIWPEVSSKGNFVSQLSSWVLNQFVSISNLGGKRSLTNKKEKRSIRDLPIFNGVDLSLWIDGLDNSKENTLNLLKKLGSELKDPFISEVMLWRPAEEITIPLISKDKSISDIKEICKEDLENLPKLRDDWETSDDFQRNLLSYLVLQSRYLNGKTLFSKQYEDDDFKELLNNDLKSILDSLDKESLENILTDIFSLSTNRLDAWITSLTTKVLKENCDQEGIFLGAYGWIDELKPAPAKSKKSQGYTIAPSTNHGATAAVLKSGALAYKGTDKANVLEVNLSSQRVQQAKWMLEGVKNGQSIGVLLGYRLEKMLGEPIEKNGKKVFLNKYVYPLRELYPIKKSVSSNGSTNNSLETITPRNVMDGLLLLEAIRAGAFSYNIHKDLKPLKRNKNEREAFERTLDELENIFDALTDLGLAESVHQSIMQNFDAAGAVLDATQSTGNPPEKIGVATGPKSSISNSYLVSTLFPKPKSFVPKDMDTNLAQCAQTVRATIAPTIEDWLKKLFGAQANMYYSVFYEDWDSEQQIKILVNLAGTIHKRELRSLKDGSLIEAPWLIKKIDIPISYLDFLSYSNSPGQGENSELEELIRYSIRTTYQLNPEVEIHLNFNPRKELSADENLIDKRTLAEALFLGRQVNRLLANSKVLLPADLKLPQEVENSRPTSKSDNLSIIEELKHSVDYANEILARLRAQIVKSENEDEIEVNEKETLKDCLPLFRHFKIRNSISGPLVSNVDISLSERAISVAKESATLLKKSKTHLRKLEALLNKRTSTTALEDAVDLLEKAAKELFGKSFLILPKFSILNENELRLTQQNIDLTTKSEDYNSEVWFKQAAQTHLNLKKFEKLYLCATAFRQENTFTFKIRQLPYRPSDYWSALPFKEDPNFKVPTDTLSLIGLIPEDEKFNQSEAIAGIKLDKWSESIPLKEETAAFSFHYNRPNTEAPNVCLLAVASNAGKEDNKWQWTDLLNILDTSMKLQKIRMVDVDALYMADKDEDPAFKGLGKLLPTLITDNYSYLNESIVQLTRPIIPYPKDQEDEHKKV